MQNLTKEQVRQFYNLTQTINFNLFVEWMKDSLNAERESSDRIKEFGDIKSSQGYRCALDDIISDLDSLSTEYKKLAINKENT